MTTHHRHDLPALTKNQALVMAELSGADGPLSAYTILDQLRGHGFRAPLQVYRALDKLVEFGLVHRLESLNAFVACRHSDCDRHEAVAFAICEACGQVTEISDDALDARLKHLAAATGFTLTKSTVELRGRCARCGTA
jgi:Fe2+/Zn2+ uptake regulation proteins